ncbi:recombinase family protein [Melghirimyces algeriensis]|uniref:Site-specific DNA recombinase n=1 Tax=Melghirimyces algeriensis TaxID=910412 RepID=A0A521CWD3_9BACL|nr:recombinase family protein [Melghirimyces algeriensis]SMO63743.1 site-specific DNA recombinase [Melghirimyces algeriensis]
MVGIYVRVSTEESAKRGYSIKDQIQDCRKKAATDEIMEYIDEGISGEFLDRPGLSKLREDIRKGLITKVVCLDPDRLSRKLMNQLIVTEELDRQGVPLLFVNGEYARTPEGQLFYSMRGAISEFEKAKINERMTRGRKQKARQGKLLRDFQVYGYDYDKEKESFVIHDQEAEVVRLIFTLFTQPNNRVKGINGIAHYLTEQGIPTKRGANVWHRQVVRQILMNRAYIGEFYQNKWNTEGMLGNKFKPSEERVQMRMRPKEEWIKIPCPPIVDEAVFYHAQSLLKESRRRWAKKGKREYLLSGLIRCGECHNTMTGRKVKNWGKYVYEYTDVKNYAGAKHRGCGKRVKCEELDQPVWEQIVRWLDHPGEIAVVAEEMSETSPSTWEEMETKRLEKEIEKTKEGRKRVLNLFAQGLDIAEEEVRESIQELKEKEEQLRVRLREMKEIITNRDKSQYSQELTQEAVTYYFSKGEKDLTFADKKELIRQVVREITVHGNRVEIYTF